jgi:hypothetical protein
VRSGTQRNGTRAAWLAAALVTAAAASGCFNPKIVDGGLLCADGGVCPDGFHCAADGTCKKGGPTKCQPASPHIAAICAPDPGTDCDPVCQSRCDCGRCTLAGTELTCVPAGSKKRGEVCTPGADDCEPGNVCLADCDSATFGRCYRFCGKGSVRHNELCDDGQDCDVPVNDVTQSSTDLWVCPAPQRTCNPGGDGTDCGNAALACYVGGNGVATVCECKGQKGPGAGCSVFNSCVAGYRCVGIATINGGAATCVRTCTLGGTDCPSGACMPIGGSAFGFCPP